jgi:hypothetical protein
MYTSFLNRLDKKYTWLATQGDFITYVEMTTTTLAGDNRSIEEQFSDKDFFNKVDVMGEALLNVFQIDISPYPDFRTMRLAVPRSTDILEKMAEYTRRDIAVREALEGTGVTRSEESIMDDTYYEVMSYDLVRRLSPYLGVTPETEARYKALGLDQILGPLQKPQNSCEPHTKKDTGISRGSI